MLEEQKHIFNQVIGYIKSEKPAAVIIAGDIYDRTIPGVEAVKVFSDFLTQLKKQKIAVLIIAGNHDSPERIGFVSEILKDSNLHLCGAFNEQLSPIILKDELGEVNFWMLPFINPSMARGFFDGREIESHSDALNAVLESTNIDYNKRNILVAHQFFVAAGVTPERSDSEINPVGGLDAVDIEAVKAFDYVALGHLHGAQKIKHDHIRYAGSPLKYSFSECNHKKSVTLVEIKEKGQVTHKQLPLEPIHDMRELEGTLEELIEANSCDDYLRITLTDKEELIEPMAKLRAVYPNIMTLSFASNREEIDVASATMNAEEIAMLSAFDLFSDFFLYESGSTMTVEQEKIVKELLQTEEEQ